MIKKIQIELIIFALLVVTIFLTNSIDREIYTYFSKLNYGIGGAYLKKFFVQITQLGDSMWYFLIFTVMFLTSLVVKKIKIISLKKYYFLRNLSLFSLFYLFFVGILTQFIKHLIGRPRPNHSNLNDIFELNFFTTESAFHSFPSGHASTIIAVTLIMCLVFLWLRVLFYICGFLIALSRVVVGAHFTTDVIAGSLVAIMVYKILNFFIKKKYTQTFLKKIRFGDVSVLVKTMFVFSIIAFFITIGPSFDIFFSSIFYYGNNQFMLQSYYSVSIIFRKFLLPGLLIYIFIFPIAGKFLPIQKIFFDYKFSFKEIIFIWLSGITTLLFVVNVLFKNMWGRARPNDILQFGGSNSFTPWYNYGDSCLSNCSFVSGDSSVGFMLVVFYFITKKNIYCYAALLFGMVLGFIRIAAGGHFFSDIVFSQIIVSSSLLICAVLYKRLYA